MHIIFNPPVNEENKYIDILVTALRKGGYVVHPLKVLLSSALDGSAAPSPDTSSNGHIKLLSTVTNPEQSWLRNTQKHWRNYVTSLTPTLSTSMDLYRNLPDCLLQAL